MHACVRACVRCWDGDGEGSNAHLNLDRLSGLAFFLTYLLRVCVVCYLYSCSCTFKRIDRLILLFSRSETKSAIR